MAHLRPWHVDDAPRLLHLVQAAPDVARQVPSVTDLATAERWCAAENDRDGYWKYAIIDDLDAVVGHMAVKVRRTHRIGWVSYWLAPDARGQGLAARALAALCDLAFAELGLHRLEIGYRLNNPASGAVARRGGFVREGVLREELEYDGVRYDTAFESRLVSDPAPDVEPLPVRS